VSKQWVQDSDSKTETKPPTLLSDDRRHGDRMLEGGDRQGHQGRKIYDKALYVVCEVLQFII